MNPRRKLPRRKLKAKALSPGYALVLVALVAISGWAADSRPLATFEIVSSSMQPTFFQGNQVVGISADWWSAPAERGDVVVFHPPTWIRSDIPVVKRIVATGGDVVEIRDAALFVNGQKQREPYARSYAREYRYGPL